MQTVLDAVKGEGKFAPDKANALSSSFGNMSTIARRLKVTRRTVINYKNKWSTVKDAIESERDALKDFVEDRMAKRMLVDNSDTMIIFFAKTQMKDRGYVERYEHTGESGDAIQLKVIKGVDANDR